MHKIIDTSNLGSKNDKIFFGDYSGFQRYDNPTFGQAVKIEEAMRGAYWNPSEISMRNDSVKFYEMPAAVQDVMCSVIFYQTLMDSAQNRGIEETISQSVTNPEWESVFKTWAYFEMIHSISYSHIIRGIFVDSSAVFESNFTNKSIISRVQREIDAYSKFATYTENLNGDDDSVKRILELILTIYALEGIKFYASFLVTYLIHDKFSSIPGAARIIKLINFDEDWHTKASVLLLDNLKQDERFAKHIQSQWFQDTAIEAFNQVLKDEKSFADYLCEQGGMELPVSRDGVHKFLDYYCSKRLSDIGVVIDITEKTSLVEWFEMYKDLNKENIAMQESDMAVYNIGVMQDDM